MNLNFTPILRSSVGFDRMARLLDAAFQAEPAAQPSYPPYNIVKTGEDGYRIDMAVAGLAESDIDVTVKESTLTVAGKLAPENGAAAANYLHRGIVARAFERRFDLADRIVVTGAALENGLLRIDLAREVPEEKKPRKIAVRRPGGGTKKPSAWHKIVEWLWSCLSQAVRRAAFEQLPDGMSELIVHLLRQLPPL